MFSRVRWATYFQHFLSSALVFYFIFHMVNGDRGLISYMKLSKEVALVHEELSDIQEKNRKLENRISLLNDRTIDLDLLEEHVFKALGVNYKGDKVYLIKNKM